MSLGAAIVKRDGREFVGSATSVNDQWRLVFRWPGGHAHKARLTDYH